MNFEFLNHQRDWSKNFPEEGRFVFLRRAQRGGPGGADDDDELTEEEEARRDREQELRRARRVLAKDVENSGMSPELKQKMRECLASGSPAQHELLERFLYKEPKEISEENFLSESAEIERSEASWTVIFGHQREIREKIQKLQWRAEGYMDYIPPPSQKDRFKLILKDIRKLNRQDSSLDMRLKGYLHLLATTPNPDPAAGGAMFLAPEAANAIYLLDPKSEDFETQIAYFKDAIQSFPETGGEDGHVIYRKILADKKDEARIERDFNLLTKKTDKIITDNYNKIKGLADRKTQLEVASNMVGVTLKPGAQIEYSLPDEVGGTARRHIATVAGFEYDQVSVKNKDGEVEHVDGIPSIIFETVDAGGASVRETMTLGRFKKWIDAVDGTDKLDTIEAAEEAVNFPTYGLHIAKGLEISYPRRKRDREGEIQTTMHNVRVSEIRDGKIHFDDFVPFQPGLTVDIGADEDMRDSLTFGEFVKWWRRYDAEVSVSLHELREHLEKFNSAENKKYEINSDANPPILVEEGEELVFPDDLGRKFKIDGVDASGISFSNGEKWALPEFLNWVKRNHVRKMTTKDDDETKKEKKERFSKIVETEVGERKEKNVKMETGLSRLAASDMDAKSRTSGSLVDGLKKAWWTTQFLSIKDLFNIGKEIMEFVKRKHERRSKGRYGEVGSRLPWIIGPEFERVKQSAENEEVNKYKEAMEQWSVETVKSTLYGTNSKDLAKACIMTLLHHGEARWDDPEFWETLNRLTARYTLKGAQLFIPKPELMPPGRSGEDMTNDAVDALWGEGTAAGWFQENISNYNSHKKNFENKFRQLENDPKGNGGPRGACRDLLRRWRDGKYVNPQEYEEMIDGAIKYGKMNAEDKMFYLIAGVLARHHDNPHGETLLHFDRIGELNSAYCNSFPMLDYFTQTYVTDYTMWDAEKKKWGKVRKMNLEDLKKHMEKYFAEDFENCKPGDGFNKYMWETMLTAEPVRTRISKGIRKAEEMDHDDAHLYIPPATPAEIDNLCTGPTGGKKYFTSEGYANAYPGFSQYLTSLSYSVDEDQNPESIKNKMLAIRDAVGAFIRYDAILDNRFFRSEGDRYARLDDRQYQRHTVVDGLPLKVQQEQMRHLIVAVGHAYGENWEWLYADKNGFNKEGLKKQEEYETKIKEMKEHINELFKSDGGEKFLKAVKEVRGTDKLVGIKSYAKPNEKAMAEMLADRHKAVEKMHGGHGGH